METAANDLQQEETVRQHSNAESGMARLMRYCGFGLACLGALTLLLEGARRADPVERFLSFSLIVCCSAVLGGYLAFRRGGRSNGRALVAVFFGCIPVFFSQLGAVLYAFCNGEAAHMPYWLRMPEVSLPALGGSLAIAVLLVAPLTALAARVFAVGWERQCAIMLCILGTALALPFRTGFMAVGIVTALVVVTTVHERRFLPNGLSRYTVDTLFVRLVLLVLPCIAAMRALHYPTSHMWAFAMVVIAVGGLVAWLWDLIPRKDRGISEFISDLSIACAALPAGIALLDSQYLDPLLGSCSVFLGCREYALLLPGVCLLLSAKLASQRVSWRVVLGHYALLIACAIIAPRGSIIMQLALVGIPSAIALQAYSARSLMTMLASIAVILYRTDDLLRELLQAIAEYRWSALMVTGIALIFGASYVEKGARRIVQHWRSKK
jgi:hypothetical protein